jgi:soluble lytic murein transglycosylase-like protein
MNVRGYAAVPAALALLCVFSPALAEAGPAAAKAPGSSHSHQASHTGLYGLLDAMAAGAGKIPPRHHAPAASTHSEKRAERHARRHHRRSARAAHGKAPRPAAAPAKAARGRRDLRALVAEYARKEGIPPALAHGVVMVESRYRPHATGHGGYIGLMQLSYRTARAMGYRGSRAALYDPETNIRYGVRYLAEAYRQAHGKLCVTVSKYQGGTGIHGVTRAGAAYCGRVRHYMAEAGAPVQTAENGDRS